MQAFVYVPSLHLPLPPHLSRSVRTCNPEQVLDSTLDFSILSPPPPQRCGIWGGLAEQSGIVYSPESWSSLVPPIVRIQSFLSLSLEPNRPSFAGPVMRGVAGLHCCSALGKYFHRTLVFLQRNDRPCFVSAFPKCSREWLKDDLLLRFSTLSHWCSALSCPLAYLFQSLTHEKGDV